MANTYYYVTLNGKDLPNCRWETRSSARSALEIEARFTLLEMTRLHINEGYYMNHDSDWDWADIIHYVKGGYGEPITKAKSHVYEIRTEEVG